MFYNIKSKVLLNAKNIPGWKTERKIIVFSVDDFGNVRLHSSQARSKMNKAGMKIFSRFDVFDSLETRQDLSSLYDTLNAVKDKQGRPAVFTAFAMPCNIDFEKMQHEGNKEYHSELLPITYEKLSIMDANAYQGTWKLWQEGINKGLMAPQFHGREHLNLKVFQEKLKEKSPELFTALRNRSYTSISSSGYATISWPAAFDFWDYSENQAFSSIIEDGLNMFEQVFGYRATNFTPPVYNCHPTNYPALEKGGIKFIDTALIHKEHVGMGRYKRKFNFTGKEATDGQKFIVRNVVFEPGDDRGIDWVSYAIQQIDAAFRWNHPAIISSHRVNFCGYINENNRNTGITALSSLLKKIVEKWPEVEFMAANELADIIAGK